MDAYGGMHWSEQDFPVQEGRVSRHSGSTNKDHVLVFDDVVLMMPGSVMYYLDNKDALGWEHNWQPEPEFISRIMRGGEICFNKTVRNRFAKQTLARGYLRRLNEETIIDTHGGDENYHKGDYSEANFGDVPEGFVERVKLILDASQKSYDDPKAPQSITLEPMPGFERSNYQFEPAEPRWWDRVAIVIMEQLEARGVETEGMEWSEMVEESKVLSPIYTDLWHATFFKQGDVATLDLGRFYSEYKQLKRDVLAQRIVETQQQVLAEVGIECASDSVHPEVLVFTGENAKKLVRFKTDVIEIDAEPTLAQKAALILHGSVTDVYHNADGIAFIGKNFRYWPSKYVEALMIKDNFVTNGDFSDKLGVAYQYDSGEADPDFESRIVPVTDAFFAPEYKKFSGIVNRAREQQMTTGSIFDDL